MEAIISHMNNRTKTGIIAFCDILGYRDILQNNDPAIVARDVISAIKAAEFEVNNLHTTNLPSNIDRAEVAQKLREYEWITFSDTIALFHQYPNDALPSDKYISWLVTIINLIYLFQYTTEKGLPLRGSVSFGNYYHDGPHFAGRPIVDAYDHSQSLCLSALALHNSALDELNSFEVFATPNAIQATTRAYHTPCKHGDSRQYLLYPYMPGTKTATTLKSDISRYLNEKFCSFGKTLEKDDARKKYNNTIAFYREFIR